MSDEEDPPQASVRPLKSISLIWLVPLVALFIGAWMVYAHLSSQGPLIVIHFETGEGIEAGKTKLKTKNVEVGLVEQMDLNESLDGIVVTARIHKNEERLLRQDTQFWVVRPRIGKGGVSGLGTLLSGAYIEISPGDSEQMERTFQGLETIPVTPSGTPGLHITLESSGYRALESGDPILFHGFDVGRIEYVHFNTQERVVYYNAFIESPYDRLITTNTRFWEINGAEVNLSADGIRIQTGTLETLITGGVTFDVPEDMPRGKVIGKRAFFTIYPNKEAIHESRYQHAVHYLVLFQDSIRGLKPGAPVEYRGVKVGKVIRTDMDYSPITKVLDSKTEIPVLIAIEPARIGYRDDKRVLPKVKKDIEVLLGKGLRAGLARGNLLTGSKYIELEYDEGVTGVPRSFAGYLVIPTFESQIYSILGQIGAVVEKIHGLPLAALVNNADKALGQIAVTLQEFESTAAQLKVLLRQSSDSALVGNINVTLDKVAKLAQDFSEDSLTHHELRAAMNSIKQAFDELEPLLFQLNQKPNSLLFGNSSEDDLQPVGRAP